MLWLFVGPTGVYLLDFFCSGIQFYLLLSPSLCFISLLYLIYTGPLKNLFHYAIFQKFFSHFFKYINGLSFTIHVIKLPCNFVSINHINV